MSMQRVTTRGEWDDFVANHDNFMFDMDGVLWSGDTLIPNVTDAITRLQELGKSVVFVTNNSTKSRSAYVPKFKKLGFTGINEKQIFGSSYAVVMYLESLSYPKDRPIFVCGGDGLREELRAAGYIDAPSVTGHFTTVEDIMKIPLDPKVGAVICGFDGNMSYIKLSIAHSYLLDPKVIFVATNGDTTYPAPEGRTFVGSGCLYAPLERSTGRHPVVCGKPNRLMLDLIMKTYNFDPKRTCMIGDRLDTDIVFGKSGGCKTMLVLSGCTREEQVKAAPEEEQPAYYSDGIGFFASTK